MSRYRIALCNPSSNNRVGGSISFKASSDARASRETASSARCLTPEKLAIFPNTYLNVSDSKSETHKTFKHRQRLCPDCVARAALARLDERLARSPLRDGFVERQHFADATAALWFEGELVHLENLVLHVAHMDIRTPTHELTRAHAVLRAPPDSCQSSGLGAQPRRFDGPDRPGRRAAGVGQPRKPGKGGGVEANGRHEGEENLLAEEFAEIDAVLARSSKILNGADVAV